MDDERRSQQGVVRRLRAMGLEPELLPGGRCARVGLPLGAEPFPDLDGERRAETLRFVTVGTSRIKCLEPEWLRTLPLIRIADCPSAAAIESAVRDAWRLRLAALRRARAELEGIGIEAEAEDGALAFPLSGESRETRVRVLEPGRLILPGSGPLGGVALEQPSDRCFRFRDPEATASDLEIAVSTRLEELARAGGGRRPRPDEAAGSIAGAAVVGEARLMLVGTLLAESDVAEALRLRGYAVESARGMLEALAMFRERSFELVLCDARLGRDEGIEMIPALESLVGIERVLLVLVDDRMRPARREAARRMGAAGYLVHPVDVGRIAGGLERLARDPRCRRWVRFPSRLPVRFDRSDGFTTSIGRGGMFLCSDVEPPLGAVSRYEVDLPEVGRTLRVEAEAVYQRPAAPRAAGGLGMRFRSFAGDDEAAWIHYLATVDGTAPASARSQPGLG